MKFLKSILLEGIVLFAFCGLLSSCFDSVHDLELGETLNSADIYLIRENGDSSSMLQVPVGESFSLFVKITPAYLQDSLTYKWFLNSKKIGEGVSFKVKDSIPDTLKIFDEAKNETRVPIRVLKNSPPRFKSWLEPSEGDTLFGNSETAFRFSFEVEDIDDDPWTGTFIVDSVAYFIGETFSFQQSGFSEGEHTAVLIARDVYGSEDTSSVLKFYVKEAR